MFLVSKYILEQTDYDNMHHTPRDLTGPRRLFFASGKAWKLEAKMRTMSNLDESTFSSWILVFVRVVFLAQFFVRMLDVSVRR